MCSSQRWRALWTSKLLAPCVILLVFLVFRSGYLGSVNFKDWGWGLFGKNKKKKNSKKIVVARYSLIYSAIQSSLSMG